MLNRRCLLHCKMQLKGSKKKQVVVAQSGIPNPGDMSYQAIPAQVKVFKEGYNPKNSFQNPKLTVNLDSARIHIVGSGSQHETKRRMPKMQESYSFGITTREGVCHEFSTEKEAERLVWVMVLEFLAMFPYSSVPDVPRCNPLFRRDLEPATYNADSIWPVYILPEEVGSRCSVIGSNVLSLQGRMEGARSGKLEIYNPTDSSDPAISWDHDKIRRTGKLGKLLFIEIGRRCRGGPGLMWMYTGANEKRATELRDTLRRFLFEDIKMTPQQYTLPQPASQTSVVESSGSASANAEQSIPPPLPPLPPLRHAISNPDPEERIAECDNQLQHNYHMLEATPCAS